MKRFNWLAAGRRWRKTTLSLHLMTEGCLKGQRLIWGAPTFDQVRIGLEELTYAWQGSGKINLGRMTAQLGNGTIYFRSMDSADNVRGYSADGVVIDEAGFIKRGVYHDVLRPMLMDTDGWLLAKGTPNGRNWFWREWQRSVDDENAMRWQIPSLGAVIGENGLERKPHPLENPHINFSEIEHLYNTSPERTFRQEILAEFLEDGGGVFRGVMRAVDDDVLQDEPIDNHQYIMGVDWGKHNDFTVLTVVDVTLGHVCHVDRFNQIDYSVQAQRLKVLADKFRPSQVIAESNSMGDAVIEQLQRMGLPVVPFNTTNATKKAIIEALSLAFERDEIRIPDDAVLIGELQAYETARTKTGLISYNAPSGMHDDTVMSLAICWSGMGQGFKVW